MTSPVVRLLLLFAGLFLAAISSSFAQGQPPPVSGVTGTVATEGTMKTVYRGLNKIVVTTIDGVEHVYQFTKDLIVHGGKSPADPLAGLKEGTTVVIHYSTEGGEQTVRELDRVGDGGLIETEGMITSIDRGAKQIAVRIGDARTEIFQMTDRAASESKDLDKARGATRGIIYYRDENGTKVIHYFKTIK